MTDEELFDQAMNIVDCYRTLPYTSMDLTEPKMFQYSLQIPEDIHWTIVGLGAANKMDYETYAEEVLLEYGAIALAKAARQLGE